MEPWPLSCCCPHWTHIAIATRHGQKLGHFCPLVWLKKHCYNLRALKQKQQEGTSLVRGLPCL